jgi:hypothetical protein
MNGLIDVKRFLPWINKGGERTQLLDALDDLEDLLKKRDVIDLRDSVDVEVRDRLTRIRRKVTRFPK